MKKYLKKIFFVFLFFISSLGSAFLILFFSLFISDFTNDFWNNVVEKFESGSSQISIAEATDFDWDTVCVLEPYSLGSSNKETAEKKYIKADLGDFKDKIPNLNDDGRWAFAFIKDGKVISIKEKGRKYWLRNKYKENCIPKSRATFVREENYLIIKD